MQQSEGAQHWLFILLEEIPMIISSPSAVSFLRLFSLEPLVFLFLSLQLNGSGARLLALWNIYSGLHVRMHMITSAHILFLNPFVFLVMLVSTEIQFSLSLVFCVFFCLYVNNFKGKHGENQRLILSWQQR